MGSMVDEIYAYILEKGRGFSNKEIVEQFFKMEGVDTPVASRLVEPLLRQDRRFLQESDGSWTARKLTSVEDMPLDHAQYVLFAIDEALAEDTSPEDPFSILLGRSAFILYRAGFSDESYPIRKLLEESGRFIFLPYDRPSLNRLKKIQRFISPLDLEIKTLSIKKMVSHFYTDKRYARWEEIIEDFSIVHFESESALSKAKTLRYVFEHVLNRARETGVGSAGELIEISNRVLPTLNFSKYGFDKGYLRDIPEKPGVYIFSNREGQIIYIGKTRNLKTRINSYFRYSGESEDKRELILQNLHDIQYRLLGSDLEALIEEFKLIDKHRPLFNKQISISERKQQMPNKILLFPSAREGFMKLYFLSQVLPLVEFDYKPGSRIKEILKKLKVTKNSAFDPLKFIALSYLERYEDRINTVEIDLFSTEDELLNTLDNHWRNLSRIFHEKVRYV
jgi:hypothetical protein